MRRNKIDRLTGMLLLQMDGTPDVAVTHFGSNYEMAIQLKNHIFPNIKNIIVFHGHDISSYINKNGWKNYKDAAPLIDLAICVNKIWSKRLKQNTAIRSIKTIYLGTEIRPARRCLNGDVNTFSILFVGRFVEKKGFGVLYEAIKSILTRGDQSIRVHCIGDGPNFDLTVKKVQNEGYGANFVFYGARQRNFVQQMMSECHLFVAPSQTAQDGDSEGLPVVLLEAMAAKIPVLSTFHSGIPEAVFHDRTGLLVPESNIVELEKAIQFAIGHPEHMEKMAVAARKYVESFHDERLQAQEFTTAIENLHENL